jgi:hypothetical protein
MQVLEEVKKYPVLHDVQSDILGPEQFSQEVLQFVENKRV